MKKYVQEATDINIWTSIKNNTFERNKDIKEFIDGLELIDESACISLDAKWGDGKTFFVRQIEEVLKYVLANQRADEENPIEKIPSYEYLKDKKFKLFNDERGNKRKTSRQFKMAVVYSVRDCIYNTCN